MDTPHNFFIRFTFYPNDHIIIVPGTDGAKYLFYDYSAFPLDEIIRHLFSDE